MTPTHIGTWGQTLIEALRKQGISDQQIVGNTGIDIRLLNTEEPRIRFDELALLFERAEDLTHDDLVGFKHGQGSDYSRGGLIAYTGTSSPTVRTLLCNLARYQRISGDAIQIDVSKLDSEGVIEWHFQVAHSVARRQYVEFGGTGLVDVIRRLTNRRVTPRKVEFRHHRKTNTKQLGMFFECPVEFGCDQNRITFKLSDLDLPLRSADGNLYKLLKKFADDALKEMPSKKASIVVSVEQCIAADPTGSQAEVANALGMSTRTLARRLTAEDTTFYGVVEGYREAMAKKMLTDTDMQATEVAFALGYADASTFSSAFKRWVGQSPTQYRVLTDRPLASKMRQADF